MSISPFDSPLLSGLLGDAVVARQFSTEAELAAMTRFEVALAEAEAAEGLIPLSAAERIVDASKSFVPDLTAIGKATQRDGVTGVEFVRQLREAVGAEAGPHVHFGATSQDVVDTALVLRLKPVLDELEGRIVALDDALDLLTRRFGDRTLIGRTRMQAALPIRVGDRIAVWRAPLTRHCDRLAALRPRLLQLQLGGAVGTLDKLGDRADAVRKRLAASLDLGVPDGTWHASRDSVAELGGWCALVTGSLGKIGMDVGLLAQDGDEIALEGGGASSAMPHKSNPVDAEILVTLARFTATLGAGMNQSLVHEQERSGAAWTLEWMVLPQIVMAAAASLRVANALVGRIASLGSVAGD